MNYKKGKIFFLVLNCILILSCSNGDHMQGNQSYRNSIDSVSEKEWNTLTQKKIFFGHQSVGFNIIDGIKEIMSENEEINFNIKETNDINDFSASIFAHSRVGQNTNASSKLENFENIIQQGLGEKVDIAFFKYCYVDITGKTDVQALFELYTSTMNDLQKDFPGTVFIHATVPLKSVTTTWKIRIKKLLGKDNLWEYSDNIKRNEFNAMLRHEYGATEKFFDIALAESTYPDGTIEGFCNNGKQYASLIPSYSNDGGHLNEKGRKVIAAQLLQTMAVLAD